MFGTYFYNKNTRNIVILFGTVFNDISIRRTDASDVVKEEIKVPIAYGPAEKFLVRLREATDISKGKVGLTLPRMSFEFSAINYDSARKLTTTKQFKAIHTTESNKLKKDNNALNAILVQILGNTIANKVTKGDKSAATILVDFLNYSKTD